MPNKEIAYPNAKQKVVLNVFPLFASYRQRPKAKAKAKAKTFDQKEEEREDFEDGKVNVPRKNNEKQQDDEEFSSAMSNDETIDENSKQNVQGKKKRKKRSESNFLKKNKRLKRREVLKESKESKEDEVHLPKKKRKKKFFKSRKANNKFLSNDKKTKTKILKVTDFFKTLEPKAKESTFEEDNQTKTQENVDSASAHGSCNGDQNQKPEANKLEASSFLPLNDGCVSNANKVGKVGAPVSPQGAKALSVENDDTKKSHKKTEKEESSQEQEGNFETARDSKAQALIEPKLKSKPQPKLKTKPKLSKKKNRKNLKHKVKNRIQNKNAKEEEEEEEEEAEEEAEAKVEAEIENKAVEDMEDEEKKEEKKRHNDFERKRRRKITAAYRVLQKAINIIENPLPGMKITHERTFQVASATLIYFIEALSSLLRMNPTIKCATHLMKRFPDLKPLFLSYAERLSKMKNSTGNDIENRFTFNIDAEHQTRLLDKQEESWESKDSKHEVREEKNQDDSFSIYASSPPLGRLVSPYPPLLTTPLLATPPLVCTLTEGNSIPFPFLVFEEKVQLIENKNGTPFREIVYANAQFKKLHTSSTPSALFPSASSESGFLLEGKETDFNLSNNLNDYLSYKNLETLMEKLFDLKTRINLPSFSSPPAPQATEEEEKEKEKETEKRLSSTKFFAPFLQNCFWSEIALTFVFPSFSSSRFFRPVATSFLTNKRPHKLDCYCLLFQPGTWANSDTTASTSTFGSFFQETNTQYGLLLLPEKWQISSPTDFDDSGLDESQES